jgi:ribulose bisphosphate carboxylase small subunit
MDQSVQSQLTDVLAQRPVAPRQAGHAPAGKRAFARAMIRSYVLNEGKKRGYNHAIRRRQAENMWEMFGKLARRLQRESLARRLNTARERSKKVLRKVMEAFHA